jgi:ApeA N-terminal domain 1/Apea-like HEPN
MAEGATEADFAAVEGALGVALIADHRALLAAENGWQRRHGECFLSVFSTSGVIESTQLVERHPGFLSTASDRSREIIGLDMRRDPPPDVMIDIASAGCEDALFQERVKQLRTARSERSGGGLAIISSASYFRRVSLPEFKPIEGEWWLRDRPEDRRFGILRRDGDRWQLEMPAGFENSHDLADASERFLIYGERLETGKRMTLLDAWVTQLRIRMPGGLSMRWSVPQVVEHQFVTGGEDRVDSLTMEIDGLLDWAGAEATALDVHGIADDGMQATARRAIIGSARSDDLELELRTTYDWDLDDGTFRIRPSSIFAVSVSDGVAMGEAVRRIVVPLRDLLIFGSLGLVATGPVEFEMPHSDPAKPKARLWLNQRSVDQSSPPGRLEMLLPLERCPIAFSELVPRWFDVATRFGKPLRMLLASTYWPTMLSETRMLSAFLSVEGYHAIAIRRAEVEPEEFKERLGRVLDATPEDLHDWIRRRLTNDRSLRGQLEDVVGLAGSTGQRLLEAHPNLIGDAVRARTFAAHALDYDEFQGERFVYCAIALRWLMRHCFLRELGMSDEQAGLVVAQCHTFVQELSLVERMSTLPRPTKK